MRFSGLARARFSSHPATVLLSQLALVAVIYWHTLRLEFVSDAWVYLARLRTGVWSVVATPTGYHYQPVACAWIALIRAVFGESALAFQAVNMAQLALLGYLTYQLGRRLLGNAGAAFWASLLVIGSAAFYEASYWPLAGNLHLLAGQFYVLAVILAHDAGQGRFGASGPWLVGLAVLAATFSHPAMVTAIPVCAWTIFVAGDGSDHGEKRADARTRSIKALLPLAAVGVLFALSRYVFGASIDSGPRPSLDLMRAYGLVLHGLVAAFSLRGSHDVLHHLLTLGSDAQVPGFWIWAFVGGWLAVLALAAGIGLSRSRSPGLRVLLPLLGAHVIIVAIAGGMSSRQGHVPAVASALLTSWALHDVAERLAVLVARAPAALLCRQIPAVVVLLLILGAQPDHVASAAVHARAGSLSRALVELIRACTPPARGAVNVTLVNMPGSLVDRGMGAATFANGLDELARLSSPRVATLQVRRMSIRNAPADFATGSMPIDPHELRSHLLDPSRVVLLFETQPFGLTRLTREGLDRLPVEQR